MIDVQINTYWNVETLSMVFNGVAAMMQGSNYSGLLKMIFIFSLGIGMFTYINGRQLELAGWFLQALIFVTVLNMPIATVTITDMTNMQPPVVVSNVPFVMAEIAEVVNITSTYMVQEYETAFGIPDTLGLEQGDVGFGHKILKSVNQAEIQDPGLRSDLMQFFKECTLYDIKDGQVSPQQIISGTNVWDTIFSNTSPARFVTYNTLTATPTTDTCQNTALVLKQRVASAVTTAQAYYGKQAFPLASSDALATQMYVNAMSSSYDWILQSSQNASDAMKQAMFNNMWRQAGSSLPAMLNDPSQVAEVSALQGEAQAALQANASNSILSLLGQETLPHIRNWLEAMIYALFPVVVILTITSSMEGAKRILGGYMMALAWIGLWPIMFAIINHLSLTYLKHKTAALSLAAGVPFQLTDVFSATLVDEQAIIGYMVVAVPFLSAGIIKLGQGGFMGVADRVMTGLSSAGSAVGGTLAMGNQSLGNSSVDTKNVNTTTMHHMDSDISLQGGGAAIGTASGGIARLSMNGTAAMETMHNNFLASIQTRSDKHAGTSQESHDTKIAGRGTNVSDTVASDASLTNITSRDSTRSSNQSSGIDASTTQTGGRTGNSSIGQTAQTQNSVSSRFDDSVAQNDSLNGSLGIGRGTSNGVGIPSGGGDATDPAEERKIERSMKEGGASPQQIEDALKKYRASKGGGGGSGFSARLDGTTARLYSAAQGRTKTHDSSHSDTKTASDGYSYSDIGSRTTDNSTSDQSSQTSRHGIDATLTSRHSSATTTDAQYRDERGVGDRSSVGQDDSFSYVRDILSDPQMMAQVAARNHMSPMRFYAQSQDKIIEQAQAFAAEKGYMKQATSLNTNMPDGKHLPADTKTLQEQAAAEQAKLKNSESAQYKKDAGKVGAGTTTPVQTNTVLPAQAGQGEGAVLGALDPEIKTSIPATTGGLDDNVTTYASPDKDIGAGRVAPAAAVGSSEWADTKDTFFKLKNLVSGNGDQADGKKLSNAETADHVDDVPTK
jgi:conjugal transfer mating pair stabilization protein TraG